MRKRPRWATAVTLLVLLGVLSATAYWWNVWPERTMRRIATLMEKGDVAGLNRIFEGGQWEMLDKGEIAWEGGAELPNAKRPREKWVKQLSLHEAAGEERSLSDRIAGRARFVFGDEEPEVFSPVPGLSAGSPLISHYRIELSIQRGKASAVLTPVLAPRWETSNRTYWSLKGKGW